MRKNRKNPIIILVSRRVGKINTMISYSPLWDTMREKNITTYALIHNFGFDAHTLNDLKHNKSVTVNTLETLCKILDCNVQDVVEITKDCEFGFEISSR